MEDFNNLAHENANNKYLLGFFKYTPATHIPIVSPEMLDYDPVEAIIVISGSYSNEVSKIIRRKYKSRLEDKVSGVNVAILKDFGLEEV